MIYTCQLLLWKNHSPDDLKTIFIVSQNIVLFVEFPVLVSNKILHQSRNVVWNVKNRILFDVHNWHGASSRTFSVEPLAFSVLQCGRFKCRRRKAGFSSAWPWPVSNYISQLCLGPEVDSTRSEPTNERTSESTVCGVNIQTRSESYDRTTKMHLRCGSRDAPRLDSFFLLCSRVCTRLPPNTALILSLFDQTNVWLLVWLKLKLFEYSIDFERVFEICFFE